MSVFFLFILAYLSPKTISNIISCCRIDGLIINSKHTMYWWSFSFYLQTNNFPDLSFRVGFQCFMIKNGHQLKITQGRNLLKTGNTLDLLPLTKSWVCLTSRLYSLSCFMAHKACFLIFYNQLKLVSWSKFSKAIAKLMLDSKKKLQIKQKICLSKYDENCNL